MHINEFEDEEKIEISPTLHNFMDDDFGVALELSLLMSNIKKEMCDVLDSLLSF